MRNLGLRTGGLLACLLAPLACQHAPEPLVVPGAELVAVQVTPVAPSFARGTRLQLVATGLYSNGAVRDLTERVDWASSAPTVAAVDSAGRLVGLAEGPARVTATVKGLSGGTTVRVTSATLRRLDVTPTSLSLARGTEGRLAVTGTFSDGSTQALTDQVTWSSAQPERATIAADGLVRALAVGQARVLARFGELSAAATVTVTPATLVSLGLTPAAATLAKGTTRQFVATGVFSDATTQDLTEAAEWSTSDAGVVTVGVSGGQRGLATAVAPGTASVSATIGGVVGSATVRVTAAELASLAATPATVELALGVTGALVATGTFTDGSTQAMTADVVWTSADPSVAEVSNAAGSQGVVTPLAVGSTTVTARTGTFSATVAVVVTPATLTSLAITPAAASTPKGLARQLEATGTFSDGSTRPMTAQVTWASSNPAVAAISNVAGTQGQVDALAEGTVTITASLGAVSVTTGFTVTPAAVASIAVAPADFALAKGLERALTATGTYTDGTTQDVTAAATWTSANAAVVAVSNATGSEGRATALAVGIARVSATLGGVAGSVEITVTPAELVSLFVTPASASVPVGRTLQLAASGRYTDGEVRDVTDSASWESDDADIARVSSSLLPLGLVSAVAVGPATITATLGAVSGSADITVIAAELVSLAVTPTSLTVIEGSTGSLAVLGTFSDASTRDVTAELSWSSQNPGVAVATSGGVVEGVSPGTTTVTGTSGSISVSAQVTVTAQQLVSIQVSQTDTVVVAAGLVANFVAVGTYDNGRTRDITLLATWASANPSIAAPRTGSGQEGTFATLVSGTVLVSASLSGRTGQATLSVSAPTLVTFAVSPATATVSVGATQAFAVIATMTDGSTATVTEDCLWESLTPAVASIATPSPPAGVAQGVSQGTATIRAECLEGQYASATLTVTP